MGDLTKQPLLDQDDSNAVAARLEEGLSTQEGAGDFQKILEQHPDEVVDYVVNRGTRKLGSFHTKDTEVLPLLRDSEIWTLGFDSADIDWERTWKRRLAELPDYTRGGGFSTTVEVEAHVVTIANASAADDAGLLNPLLEKFKDGALTSKIFGVPAVQAIIEWKWSAWAMKYLLFELYVYLVWLLSFQAFVWLFQDENLHFTLKEVAHTTIGRWTIASAVLSLVATAVFMYIELCTILEYGLVRWLNVWNGLDIITYALQIAICTLYFARIDLDSVLLSVLLASQVLLLYWKIQYFSRAFQPLKNSFVETLRAVILSVRWFLVLLVVTLWGFAGAFYILYRTEQGVQFDTVYHSFLTCVGFMVNGAEFSSFMKSKTPIVGTLLLLFFVFTMTMVLLNALIAIMSDAATAAADTDGTRFLAAKAEIIDELEQSLPSWLHKPDWYPKYVHVLKLNPKSAATIESSSLWALSESNKPTGGGGEDGPDESSSEDLKAELRDVRAELAELKELLHRAFPLSSSPGPAKSSD